MSDDQNPESYGKTPPWLANLPDLGNGNGNLRRGAIALWCVLWSYRRKANGYRVWPSQELLGRLLDCDQRTIRRFLAELVRVGAITVTEVPLVSGLTRGKRNEYELRPDPPWGSLSISAQWRLDHSGRTGHTRPLLTTTTEQEDRTHTSGPGRRTGHTRPGGPDTGVQEDRTRVSAEELVLEELVLENPSFQAETTARGGVASVDNRNDLVRTNHNGKSQSEPLTRHSLPVQHPLMALQPDPPPQVTSAIDDDGPEPRSTPSAAANGRPSVAELDGWLIDSEQRTTAEQAALDAARIRQDEDAIALHSRVLDKITAKRATALRLLAEAKGIPA